MKNKIKTILPAALCTFTVLMAAPAAIAAEEAQLDSKDFAKQIAGPQASGGSGVCRIWFMKPLCQKH